MCPFLSRGYATAIWTVPCRSTGQGTKQLAHMRHGGLEHAKHRLGLAWERTDPGEMFPILPHRAGGHRRDKVWADLPLERGWRRQAGADSRTTVPTVWRPEPGLQEEGFFTETKAMPCPPPTRGTGGAPC